MSIKPNQPMVNEGYLYIYGLQAAYATATTFTVGAGQARESNNINDINLLAGVTVNSAVNGLNGLDTGAIAASSLYYIYAIGDSLSNDTSLKAAAVQPFPPIQPPVTITPSTGGFFQPGGAIISLSATGPVLPAGFDMYRLIGTVLTDGSKHFISFGSYSNSTSVSNNFADGISILAGGAATTFTAVDVSLYVPKGATSVKVIAALTADAGATRTAAFRGTGSGSVAGQVIMSSPASTVTTETLTIPVATIAGVVSFDYLVSNASAALSLSLVGYNLPV